MDMSTATTSMSMSHTMSGMSMPSSTTSSMSGSGMDMMPMSDMAMVFFTSTSTPLFSSAWTPRSTGQYAGTCIFLIAFAAIFRALLALRSNIYSLLDRADARRHGLAYETYKGEKSSKVRWRARQAVIVGFLDLVLAGVGYLLMIAVMTMNVGYFVSVLAGVFVGSVVTGHWLSGAVGSCG